MITTETVTAEIATEQPATSTAKQQKFVSRKEDVTIRPATEDEKKSVKLKQRRTEAKSDAMVKRHANAGNSSVRDNAKVAKAKSSKPSKQTERPLSKCAFIDSLLEKGGMTMDEIAKKAADKFKANLKSTMATVRVRPCHMRKAGKTPKWVTEPKEAK